jgi:gamma-glutamylcyclotransferase (GGCT)/AIG2-like uncharacterized protein YtfP
MERIFTYGTLQDTPIQLQVIGRKLDEGTPDTLRDYRMATLVTTQNEYFIIQPQTGSVINGIVYEVTAEELIKIDEYEGDAYLRVEATLVSNTRAWVYRDNPDSVHYSQIRSDKA